MLNRKRLKKLKTIMAVGAAAALSLQLMACGESTGVTASTDENGSTEAEADTENTDTAAASDTDYDGLVIRLAVQKTIYTPYLAESLGYYEEEFAEDGITVELTEFSLGPAIVEAFASGEIDIGFMGNLPAFAGLVNGGEYKIIGKYQKNYNAGLIVRDDARINSLSDLAGKRVAVPLGSNLQPLLEIYLEEAGLTDADIELTNLSLTDITTSISSGDIDAAVTSEPYITQALENDDVTELVTAEGYKAFLNPILATNEFLEEYPELAARVLKVLQKTAEWSEENPDEAIVLSAEAVDADEESIAAMRKNTDWNIYLEEEDIQIWEESVEQCYKYELITDELDVEQYIDTSYLEQAGLQ